jgi:hypothetical protein
VSSRLDALAYIFAPLLPESLKAKKLRKLSQEKVLLARIIHQPEKSTGEGDFVVQCELQK